MKVSGPLDFNLTDILAGITGVMAKEIISVFAISEFDTDYILLKKKNLKMQYLHSNLMDIKLINL